METHWTCGSQRLLLQETQESLLHEKKTGNYNTLKVITKSLPKFKEPKTLKISTQITGHVRGEEGGIEALKSG